jgi:hypothetical protein
MSRQRISAALRTAVSARAANCCEYCRVPEMAVFFGHEPDHVIAEQHGGETTLENLALACVQCNRFKGPNIASLDPETGVIVAIFNPRTDTWSDHFRFDGGQLIPLTPVGRATARLLNFDDRDREEVRRKLWLTGHLRA